MNISGPYYSIEFQEGPVKVNGVNGTQADIVLRGIAAYLKDCQKRGPCRETALAITHVETAVLWLEERTRIRELAKVEGTEASHEAA